MAYWKHTFNLPTLGQQKIELHKYSEKCIALRSSSKFGKAFRKQFKEVGGKVETITLEEIKTRLLNKRNLN